MSPSSNGTGAVLDGSIQRTGDPGFANSRAEPIEDRVVWDSMTVQEHGRASDAQRRRIRNLTFRLPILLAVCSIAFGIWHVEQLRPHGSTVITALWGALLILVVPAVIMLGAWRVGAGWAAVARAEVEARNQLEGAHDQMQDIVESLIDPLIQIDSTGTVLDANSACERVFGRPRDEVVGHNVNQLMGEPYRSSHDDYIRRYLEGGAPQAIGRVRKVLGRRGDGEDFPCEISISELENPSGERRFIGIVRDVSEREHLMAMLTHSERLAAVGELAASVAHEVNNPVNTIINCAQLMVDGDEDPSLQRDILSEGERVASIVRELLDLARDRKPGKSTIDVPDLVTRTLSLVRRRVASQGIRLRTYVDPDLPSVVARDQHLQQVLLNLVLNARDALVEQETNADKAIDLRVESIEVDGEPWLRISVEDNGPGIPEQNLQRVFQPFFTTKSDRGGAGLGLHICRRIADDHDGRLVVDSEVRRFTRMVLEIPAQPNGVGE